MRSKLEEVQALRAVAVIAVVAYHLRPSWFPGGFVGVDVFFVISGFLITRHLLKEIADRGRISMSRFWANRLRRILPASLVVIVATMAAVWVWYPIDTVERISSQGLASTWYVQNWALAAEAVDYLAAGNQPTPLQHFWSLSVEEQFYLVWPILLTLVTLVVLRTHRGESDAAERVRRWLTVAMAVVVVGSFGYSVALVHSGTPSAYFNTLGRLWELGAGGVLAALYRDPQAHPRLRAILSAAGFALIGAACILLNGDTDFPGVAALPPIIGAVLVIASGRMTTRLSLAPILEWRPIQAIGDWSYSIYLWHFGLIVTATTILQTSHFSWQVDAGLLAGTVAISYLSYRFVEQPFRSRGWQLRSTRTILVISLAGLLLCTAASLALPQKKAAIERDWTLRAGAVSATTGTYQVDPDRPRPLPPFPDERALIAPSPLDPAADWRVDDLLDAMPPGSSHPCQAGLLDTNPSGCATGSPAAPFRVVLVGDSHATMLVPPLVEIAKERNWRLETYLHSSCPFTLALRQSEVDGGLQCTQPNREILARLLADPPDMVISMAYAIAGWAGVKEDPEVGIDGYAAVWRQLQAAGIQVVAFRDTPRPQQAVVACVVANYSTPEKCGQPVKTALREHDEIQKAARKAPGVRVIDLAPAMCSSTSCPAVINHVLVYQDSHHITRTWARALRSYIDQRLP